MIPKVIHYCWLGDNKMSEKELKCIASWKKFCPDYEIKEWNESNLDFDSAPAFVKQAYEAKAWGFVPDYFRLWIIYNYGGIYLDTDVEIIKNFDPLLENKAFAGFECKDYVNLGVGFGAEPKNLIIYDHMKMYDTIAFKKEDGTFDKTPSPFVTTACLSKHGLIAGKEEIQDLGEMVVYPKEYFAPKSFDTGIIKTTKKTYSIHQYSASWFTPEEKEQLENARKKYKTDKIKYLPNKIVIKLLGKDRYENLKKRIKGN